MATIIINERCFDKKFVRKLEEISGTNFHQCMQCGTCSGGCPMVDDMDVTPRRLMLLAHMGRKDLLDVAKTAWLCASCHKCEVRCPRGIDIPKTMEAIRQIKLRENENYIEPFEIPTETIKEAPQIAMISCFRKMTS